MAGISSRESTLNQDFTIPNGAVYLKVWISDRYNSSVGNQLTVYEVSIANKPKITESEGIEYPILTSTGIKAGNRTISIEYFSSSVQRLYSFDNSDWKEYNGPIKVDLEKTIYAKGIDKNGKETGISSHEVTVGDALGAKVYDNDDDSCAEYSYLSDPNTLYLSVDSSMYEKYFDIKYSASYNSTKWNECTITFLDASNNTKESWEDIELTGNKSSESVYVPKDCAKIKFYIHQGRSGSEGNGWFNIYFIKP